MHDDECRRRKSLEITDMQGEKRLVYDPAKQLAPV